MIQADGPLTFSSLKQPDPLAVVLYLPQTTIGNLPAEQSVDSDRIVNVLARDGVNNSGTARLEIRLAQDVAYKAEQQGNYTDRLALAEELKTMPFGSVWDYYCLKNDVPVGKDWLDEVKKYETQVLSKR